MQLSWCFSDPPTQGHATSQLMNQSAPPTTRSSVSVIIPMRNEAQYIEACIQSIVTGNWPAQDLEIIVVDGASDDSSRRIVTELMRKWPQIQLIDNPNRTAPHAMNIGINTARGDFVLRMDAHVIYDADYIVCSVHALQAHEGEGAVGVGGIAKPVGMTYRSCAIALATRSPFGAGDAHYRFASTARWVDTIWNGCWRRQTLLDVGGFNEQWLRNQDYELNYRLRQAGGRLLLDPAVHCRHYMRRSLWRLTRQYFQFGTWRVRTLREHPGSLRLRQLAAPCWVLGLVLTFVIGITLTWLPMIALVGFYLLAATAFATHISWPEHMAFIPGTIVAFFTMHTAWGLGFFNGLRRFGIPRVKSGHLRAATSSVDRPLS